MSFCDCVRHGWPRIASTSIATVKVATTISLFHKDFYGPGIAYSKPDAVRLNNIKRYALPMEKPAASNSFRRVNTKSIMVVAAVDAVMFRIALDNTPNLGFTFPSKAKEYMSVPVDIRLRPTNIHNTLSIAVFNFTPNIVAEVVGSDQAKMPAATSGMYKYFFNFSGGMIVVNVSIFIKVAYDITSGAKYGLKPTLIND